MDIDFHEKVIEYMEILRERTIREEGSLEGMCFDLCMEMKRKFDILTWYEGCVWLENGECHGHHWMIHEGTVYDPTVDQFNSLIIRYESNKVRQGLLAPD